eukprot:m.115966 g.115966  ORF g.115966 m.115966 type:complete len:94 (+) comp15511_c0_seq1:244-525(+)
MCKGFVTRQFASIKLDVWFQVSAFTEDANSHSYKVCVRRWSQGDRSASKVVSFNGDSKHPICLTEVTPSSKYALALAEVVQPPMLCSPSAVWF